MSNQSNAAHRRFAVEYNNLVWELLGQQQRPPIEDQKMVHAAHASHMHWLSAGTAVHHQRGLWLISRVYAELGNGAEALNYAQLCAQATVLAREEIEVFDEAYSLEALARAHTILGDFEQASALRTKVLALSETITDEETQKLLRTDIESGNWGGL